MDAGDVTAARSFFLAFVFVLTVEIVQVLYDNDMAPGSDFSVCNDTIGEDYGCDQQVYIRRVTC